MRQKLDIREPSMLESFISGIRSFSIEATSGANVSNQWSRHRSRTRSRAFSYDHFFINEYNSEDEVEYV